MKGLNQWIRESLGFSKMEANGVLVLIPLIMLLMFSSYLFDVFFEEDVTPPKLESHELVPKNDEQPIVAENEIEPTKELYNPRPQHIGKKSYDGGLTKPKLYEKRVIEKFDLNEADTLQLRQIYGIGKVLSARIIKYRDLVGGFVSRDQLNEVYGLQDSILTALDTLTFITPDFQPKFIYVNTFDIEELAGHPYVSWKVAKAIKNYQFQHGDFPDTESLRKVRLVDSILINRISPYLKF